MEVKKNRVNNTTITRDIYDFTEITGNVYESVALLSKRSNQIAQDMKRELHKKIDEFAAGSIDTMEEVYENREQIEIVRHFEQMPKPTLLATQEFLEGRIYYRNPDKESREQKADEGVVDTPSENE